MTDRVALLRAIAARPADDTPRLVYADWLDDHGAGEADAARAELIRIWFSLRPGMRSTTRSLAGWLTANWRRLWPGVAAAANRTADTVRAQGRVLTARLAWHHPHRGESVTGVKAYFDRGFAELVQFGERWGYEQFWGPFATDEPVARYSPMQPPAVSGPVTWVRNTDWGDEVFDRLMHHWSGQVDVLPDGVRVKRFTARIGEPHSRLLAFQSITHAMTFRAREANGLAELPT